MIISKLEKLVNTWITFLSDDSLIRCFQKKIHVINENGRFSRKRSLGNDVWEETQGL